MAPTDDAAETIARLQAENERLRSQLDDRADGAVGSSGATEGRHSRGRWRAAVAVVLIVIGALLAPVAVVGFWAKTVVNSTDTFVSTLAPLIHDPAIQSVLVNEVVTVINEKADINGTVSNLFDGLEALDLPPRAKDALKLLEQPAAAGVNTLIRTAAERLVASDAIASVWEQSLRISHTQILGALQSDSSSALVLGPNGEVGIQIAPIIEAVKTALVNQGFGLAAQIPVVDRVIPIAQSDSFVQARTAYRLLTALGFILPWASLILLAAGVLVARHRATALIWAGLALAFGMSLIGIVLALGGPIIADAVASPTVPRNALLAVYDAVTPGISSPALALGVLGVAVAVVAYLSGPFRGATALRRLAISGATHTRAAAQRAGFTTGRVGEWLYRARHVLRAAIVVIAVAILLFTRPLTPAIIIWTLVIAVVVVALLELLQRPPGLEPPPKARPDSGSGSGDDDDGTGTGTGTGTVMDREGDAADTLVLDDPDATAELPSIPPDRPAPSGRAE